MSKGKKTMDNFEIDYKNLKKLRKKVCKASDISVFQIKEENRQRNLHYARVCYCLIASELYPHCTDGMITSMVHVSRSLLSYYRKKASQVRELQAEYLRVKQKLNL